jgi:hypothetical protein
MPRPFSYSLREQYGQLVNHLRTAHEMMKSSNDDGRDGLRFACQAVINFLHHTGAPPEAGSPIVRLRNGFDELKNGQKPRIFSNKPDPSRRPKGMDKRWARRFAVACANLLKSENGLSLAVAYAKVARHAQNWPGLEGQQISAKTIQSWRQAARGNEAQNIEALCEEFRRSGNVSERLAKILRDGPPAGVHASKS